MNDRNQPGTAVPTGPTDPALQRILAMPGIAAQLLHAAADELSIRRPGDELTVAGWGRALAVADARVLTGYPSVVAQNAARRAMGALSSDMWAEARSRSEWALLLRRAAETV